MQIGASDFALTHPDLTRTCEAAKSPGHLPHPPKRAARGRRFDERTRRFDSAYVAEQLRRARELY
jgi:hypothetical protein